jgi:hypothetical protein
MYSEGLLRSAQINNKRKYGVSRNVELPLFQDVKVPLPTLPAIVGSNYDWTKINQDTPGSVFFRTHLLGKRNMLSRPISKLDEPNGNSVSTM